MHSRVFAEMQSLESRRLLAHTLPGWLGDPTVQADQEALTAATQQLFKDQRSGRMTIRDDQSAIRDELKKLADDKGHDSINAALQPLKDKLRADEKSKNKEIRAAEKELRIARRDGAKLLLADTIALRKAKRSGVQADIDAAQKKLTDDKAKVQADLKPIRDDLMAVKDKWRPIITADHDAITAKLEDLDSALKPLYTKLDSDADALTKKLTADQKAVQDAYAKLAADIKTWQDAHKSTMA
jgi:hypothetical protein